MGQNLTEIIALANQINEEQLTIKDNGDIALTPHVVLTSGKGDKIKVGNHYLPLSDSVIIGVTITHGTMGKETVLYPTDISAVKPQGFTFERTDLK